VQQLTNLGLIDEYTDCQSPHLGKWKTLFKDIKDKLKLKLVNTRVFENGNVLLCYEPAKD
jgi:hypothetical protein